MMDPRRRIDERADRLAAGRVPFIESYRDVVLEPQPLGQPLEREVIVLRIDKSQLKLYAAIFGFIVLLAILSAVFA